MVRRGAGAVLLWVLFGAGCSDWQGAPGTETTGPGGSSGAASEGPGSSSAGSSDSGSTSTGSTSSTSEATTTTTTTTTTGGGYCHFSPNEPEPFMTVALKGQQPLVDGALWPLECGGQGSWMFGLYPEAGGWDPMTSWLTFNVSVEVEGYLFPSGPTGYYIGCSDPGDGGVVGVLPVFPPDEVPDLSVLDGLPAKVHVETNAGGQVIAADATVTLSAPIEVVSKGCVL